MLATDHRSSRIRLGLRPQLIIAMGMLAALIAAVAATALLTLQNVREDTSHSVVVDGELNRIASDVVSYTQLCRLHEAGKLDLEAFVTARYPLERVNDACADLQAGKNVRGILTFT